ncbi:hypothetical protein [Sphingomonas sp.]|jgi:hypothetical protein|nr:hypothetical protein [Sphingomonas sp.]
MQERRLLVGMAGVVAAVLCALALQVATDMRQARIDTAYGSRG